MNTTASYWGSAYFDQAFNRTEWQAHPLSLARQRNIQDGMQREVWFAKTYLDNKPLERALGIGVGRAETELGLVSRGIVQHYDLYDVSPVGLAHAKKTADEAGFGDRITCHCGDFTEAKLQDETYDLITFVASLHHMDKLEDMLWSTNRALKNTGLLWAANEYVGPDRFEYPERDLHVVRAFHASLPTRFRKHGLSELVLPTPEEVAAADPSESICSSLIVSTMQKIFPRLDIIKLYGSFAFMLFWGLNHDALYESEEGEELVRTILALDQSLVEIGALPNYFVHAVARKTTPIQEQMVRMGIPYSNPVYRALRNMRNALR